MFATLDSIDWNSLGYHTYGRNAEIPQAVRKLLSPEEVEREDARGFLLGAQQDFGDIYDSTPHIIPYCLEVLAMAGAPGKAELMDQLSGQGMYIASREIRSVHMLDLCLQTYAALRAGLPIYLDLLVNGDTRERLAACELLQYMTDDVEELIPFLLKQVEQENDVEIQVGLLYCLKKLFASLEWPRYSLKNQYAPALQAIVEGHPAERVQVAAARASIELISIYRLKHDQLLSAQVPNILVNEFLQPGPAMHWTEASPTLQQEYIVRDLARLSDPAPLLQLLNRPETTPEQAHLLTRGLLCQAFVRQERQHKHWMELAEYSMSKRGDFYIQDFPAVSGLKHSPKHLALLWAIAKSDSVWARPTILFSFFFGLPDTRAELQELLESFQK